jgi:Zn-dependent protease
MGLINLLQHDPLLFCLLVPILLYSVIVHEVAHGAMALLFGDDTAKRYGRLTLNPIPHLDPIGSIALLLVGFGWAKPVPVNYAALRHSRFGLVAVSLAGCATNILIATIAVFLLQLTAGKAGGTIEAILSILAKINIILGAFNLIPIPPLDGSRILTAFLPESAQERLAAIEPYGFFILIALLFSGILNHAITFIQSGIYLVIGLLLGPLTGRLP